ncbi:MAG: hypothetical protein ACJAWS_001790 [Oleiphilaceae bacterium]|jgi:hypothetical protein
MNIYPIQKAKVYDLEETYRNYQLVSYLDNGKCIGEIYKKNLRIGYCESDSMITALQNVRSIVDKLIKEKMHERKNSVPTKKQFIQALTEALPSLTKAQHSILSYQVIHHNSAIKLEELKIIAGCQTTTDVYFILADFARTLCDELAYEPPAPIEGRDPFLAIILKPEVNYANMDDSIRLQLHAEFFSALRSINW